MCRGPIMPQMDAPSNPAEPHGRVTQPLLERCVHVAGAPLDPRRPCGGARPARCGSTRRPSARCLPFTVPVLGTSHLFILRVGFLFSRLPDCGPPPRCRDRFGGQAQVPRHVNFFLGRPTVDNRRFSIGTPEEARPPEAATTSTRASEPARRTAPPFRVPPARTPARRARAPPASPPPASPLSSRAHLFPSTRP